SAKTLEVSRLQPAYDQLLLPIYQKEDNVVVGEASLSDSLNVVHDRVQKLKEGAISHYMSISDAMSALVDPLSSENLIGEASTSEVQATVAATTTLSISVTAASASSISPISVADYDVLDAGIQGEVPHSLKILFEKETLETTSERPTTSRACYCCGAFFLQNVILSFVVVYTVVMCELFEAVVCSKKNL
ncbi:hypothetical protein Tco_1431784, partial [Tanacetum coccineum]